MFEKIEDERVMSPEEISKMLNISKETVRRWCRTGKLPNLNCGGKYMIIGSDFKELLRTSTKGYKTEGERMAN
ncbi:helix-turn-helix domain-containing protein [Neobacillus drentensis]|uniref:helix-turn-helix domain-containing protein n=1 Tax=Neobacillus drentensis TaxID=220684 RepID=UPI0028576676|nr:helix-turn-helix domain-containing protein [Neobacillus drentensis]MDR7237309.1 excisionase family DNA binding protein [Neobacillus drentensis]